MTGADLPSYDDLPVKAGAPSGSSWGLWGDDDVRGCLNLLTPERIVRATRLVRTGEVHRLDLEINEIDPPLFGRSRPQHTVLGEVGGSGHDDVIDGFNTQSGTQWDGFRHVGGPHGFYNGVADEDHGIHHWATTGIVGRAVLADVARWREEQGRPLRPDAPDPISAADVEATLAAQAVEIEIGDLLLVRTGWLAWYRTLDPDARASLPGALAAPGLEPGAGTARFLWDLHIAAVAADNPALELWPLGSGLTKEERAAVRADPDRGLEVFVHLSLLPKLGLPIGELFDLEGLAAACAADGRYDCLLVSAPLHVRSGVASPPNALAIR
jgi:hypothetical protein